MKIVNARVFYRGVFVPGGIAFQNGRITAVGKGVTGPGVDARGATIIPGLVDIHTHGAMGADASDGEPRGLLTLSRYYGSEGVTSWCPTTMTLKEADLHPALSAIRDFTPPPGGAKIAGIHLEGPFLSHARRGAQAAEALHTPDISMFHRLNHTAGGLVRLVTLAPELPGALDFIREVSRVCTISLGHTQADYDTALAAYGAGAGHTTHLYNGMPPLHHRQPGVIAAALDAGATVELIPDGLHIHPAVVRLTQRLFGDRLVLVSDSLRCAGMPDGEYTLGGQCFTLQNGRSTLTGTDTLAGSSISLMEGLRRAVSFGVPPEAAITAATLTPAEVIGKQNEIGSLEPGKAADFVLLGPKLEVLDVYIDGKRSRPV